MDEREQFLRDYHRQFSTMIKLCDRYGVSRKTGYKWVARYEVDGAAALIARSSRPHHSPQATTARLEEAIVALRRQHPTWGGKKIVAVLAERDRTGRARRQHGQ